MRERYWHALGRAFLKPYEVETYSSAGDWVSLQRAVKQRLFSTVWQRLEKWRETSPPILNRYDCPFIRFDRLVRVEEVPASDVAQLIPRKDGFDARIGCLRSDGAPRSWPQRRVLLAHEIAHTFLYDLTTNPPSRLAPRSTSSSLTCGSVSDQLYKAEDGFVWEIAREILLPRPLLQSCMPRDPGLDPFFQACRAFLVTKEFLAKRLFWSPHDFQTGENYWHSAVLVMYPTTSSQLNSLPPPRGNRQVHRGIQLRSLRVGGAWWTSVLTVLAACAEYPNSIIRREVRVGAKGSEWAVEALLAWHPHARGGTLYVLGRRRDT